MTGLVHLCLLQSKWLVTRVISIYKWDNPLRGLTKQGYKTLTKWDAPAMFCSKIRDDFWSIRQPDFPDFGPCESAAGRTGQRWRKRPRDCHHPGIVQKKYVRPPVWKTDRHILVGGWPNPSAKWWSSSVGMMIIPNILRKKTCSKPPTSI